MSRRKGRNTRTREPGLWRRRSASGVVGRSSSVSIKCPECGCPLKVSETVDGLSYCPSCRLFFHHPSGYQEQRSLAEVLMALREMAGTNTLFTTVTPGIAACLLPGIEDGKLNILRHIAASASPVLLQTLLQERPPLPAMVDTFTSQTGYDYNSAIYVFNAIRRATGRKEITAPAGTRHRERASVAPPRITGFECLPATEVMESEKVTAKWTADADKVILVHRYNDYETLTVDVSHCQGEFSFTATRTEVMELVAERRSQQSRKSLMLNVVPLPRFKVASIPQLTDISTMEFHRMPVLSPKSSIAELEERIQRIAVRAEGSPYKSLTENLRRAFAIAENLFKR